METKTCGSMPQVSLVTQPAIAIVSWLLLFMGRPAFPRQPKRLASLKLMLLQLLMQDSPPLLGSSHSNRDGVPRVSGPTGALNRQTLALSSIGFPSKGTRVICLFRQKAPLEVPGLPAFGAWFLAEDGERWIHDRPCPSQITHHTEGVQTALDPVLGKRARHRVPIPTPTTRRAKDQPPNQTRSKDAVWEQPTRLCQQALS